MNQQLRNFVLAVLDDDHGISETAWQALHDVLQGSGEFEFAGELACTVDACDGRYYLDAPTDKDSPDDKPLHYPGWPGVPVPPAPEVRDTLKTWADEKEQLQHLLDLAQCSEV